MKKFLLFILLFVSSAVAEPEEGFDLPAAVQYPGIVRSIPLEYGFSTFATTFGDSFDLVKNELYRGRVWVLVQFIWKDDHNFSDKDIEELIRLSKKFAPLCNTGRLQISFFCEHNTSNPDKYANIVADLMPGCEIVNTPWKGALSLKYLNELHGDHAVPSDRYRYQYSEDGGFKNNTDPNDIDKVANKKKWKKAKRYRHWTARNNLRWSMNDKRSRAERLKNPAKPTKEFFGGQLWYTKPKGETWVAKGVTVKPYSENHGPNASGQLDLKGDKLLIIAPQKSDKVQLKRNGQVVGNLFYYGPFDGGGHRYYGTKPGWKYGPDLEMVVNRKIIGKINGGYRENARN